MLSKNCKENSNAGKCDQFKKYLLMILFLFN